MSGPFQVLKEYRAATQVTDVLEDGARDARQYRTQAWWARLVTAAGKLYSVLPIAASERRAMNQFLHKVGIGLGIAVSVIGAVDPHALAVLSPKAGATVTTIGTVLATLAALFHQIPGATDQPAK